MTISRARATATPAARAAGQIFPSIGFLLNATPLPSSIDEG
jgi:hypothetical protein